LPVSNDISNTDGGEHHLRCGEITAPRHDINYLKHGAHEGMVVGADFRFQM
jgi:hypothetical protein